MNVEKLIMRLEGMAGALELAEAEYRKNAADENGYFKGRADEAKAAASNIRFLISDICSTNTPN